MPVNNVRYTTAYKGQSHLLLQNKGTTDPAKRRTIDQTIETWANNQGPSVLDWQYVPPADDFSALYTTTETTATNIDPFEYFSFIAPPSGCVNLASSFSVANTDPTNALTVQFVWYYQPDINTNNLSNTNTYIISPLAITAISFSTPVTGFTPKYSYTVYLQWNVYSLSAASTAIISGNTGWYQEAVAIPVEGITQ